MQTNTPNEIGPRPELIDPGHARGNGPDQRRLAGALRSLRGVPSRRDVLRGLTATGMALGLAAFSSLAETKANQRRKPRKLKPEAPNQYGCLDVKDPCRRHSQCCSGICTGQPGRKPCRGHGTGTCKQATPAICETSGIEQAI